MSNNNLDITKHPYGLGDAVYVTAGLVTVTPNNPIFCIYPIANSTITFASPTISNIKGLPASLQLPAGIPFYGAVYSNITVSGQAIVYYAPPDFSNFSTPNSNPY